MKWGPLFFSSGHDVWWRNGVMIAFSAQCQGQEWRAKRSNLDSIKMQTTYWWEAIVLTNADCHRLIVKIQNYITRLILKGVNDKKNAYLPLKSVQNKTVVHNFEWLKKNYFLSADLQANPTDINWQKVFFLVIQNYALLFLSWTW